MSFVVSVVVVVVVVVCVLFSDGSSVGRSIHSTASYLLTDRGCTWASRALVGEPRFDTLVSPASVECYWHRRNSSWRTGELFL